ncbi:MAG: 50S ribosomal protein L32 [Flavobacteriales bacterium]|jgi:large subunit ribosomal protein L32|nr:50S ribosomal protein L32 [Flavobacteriales bacterium]
MPNPKRRFSHTRTASRRSTKKAGVPTISTDSATGEVHLRHRAFQVGDDLMYRGKVVYTKAKAE